MAPDTNNDYSVPAEARRVLEKGILENPLIHPHLPQGAVEAAQHVTFDGSHEPSLPVNWRFAESISALKAYEATVLSLLLQRKYGVGPVKVQINTDHAQLFIMSTFLWTLDPEGEKLSIGHFTTPGKQRDTLLEAFPDADKYETNDPLNAALTNIYRTKDGRFFHVHGSMNANIMMEALGLSRDRRFENDEERWKYVGDAVAERTADEMQILADKHRQAGTICFTRDEYKASEHGKANEGVGLFELEAHPDPSLAPGWWPSSPRTSAARPLGGLKVVDLTRVIAGPAVSRGLAELGASVMRVTAPHLADMSHLHADLSAGKWSAALDLRSAADRRRLRDLLDDADVFLQGYRPGVLDRFGFGERDVLARARARGRRIVYAAVNSYGWQGPWMGRSGWQQISDACCGVSYEYGRAMGNDEPVTPIFPNADYCTGVAGTIGIMTALLRQAEEGGSFTVKVALNYYSQWLVDQVGTYPPAVWDAVWRQNGAPVFRHHHPMQHLLPRALAGLARGPGAARLLGRPDFFTHYHATTTTTAAVDGGGSSSSSSSGSRTLRIVAPVLRFPGGEVRPGFDVGTRGNGCDDARWPEDLDVEVVAAAQGGEGARL